MNYQAILKHYGWSYFGDCICGGSHFNKYSHAKHPGYELWLGDEIGAFRIYDASKSPLADDRAISRLEATIRLNNLY